MDHLWPIIIIIMYLHHACMALNYLICLRRLALLDTCQKIMQYVWAPVAFEKTILSLFALFDFLTLFIYFYPLLLYLSNFICFPGYTSFLFLFFFLQIILSNFNEARIWLWLYAFNSMLDNSRWFLFFLFLIGNSRGFLMDGNSKNYILVL